MFGDSDATTSHCNDGRFFEISFMAGQQILNNQLALATGNVGEPNKTCMRNILDEHEFTKIGINRDENSVVFSCPLQQHSITRIRPEFAGLDNIMPLIAKPVSEETAGATVY
jgi:hypothetical protein